VRKFWVFFIGLFLSISLFGCRGPLPSENTIPFLSYDFYSKDPPSNLITEEDIFLNLWDIEKGKVYLDFEKLYRASVLNEARSSCFPYFWDGENDLYLHCTLKEVFKKDLHLSSFPSGLLKRLFFENYELYKKMLGSGFEFNLYKENPYWFLIDGNSLLLYRLQESAPYLALVYNYEVPNLLNSFKNLHVDFIFEDQGGIKALGSYPCVEKGTLYDSPVLISIDKDGDVQFIKPEWSNKSPVALYHSQEIETAVFKKGSNVFLLFCPENNCGEVWSLNIETGYLMPFVDLEGKVYKSVQLGGYKDYVILYNAYSPVGEATSIRDGKVVGQIKFFEKEGKIEVYDRDGKLSQKIDVGNRQTFVFPNYSQE